MARKHPVWARSLIDPTAFEHEQTRLGQVWTLLGVVTDVANDGDWFRTLLGGRSIFVQRFCEDLRGFENVCAHRFYPLRTKDKGNGPIRCGFHHWQYNKDGLAVGIPKCQEIYGVSPRELDARLKSIEIATCGILIFGRFPTAEKAETLEQFLGVGFDILQTMCSLKGTLYRLFSNIAANWKLGFHITLDDYHIVAVHPDTFGKRGYLPTEDVHYHRFGQHSAFFSGADGGTVEKMAADCRCGSYRPPDYRILQFFPNLVVVHFQAARSWFVLIQQYVPIRFDHTQLRSWYFRAPFPPVDNGWLHRVLRRAAAPWLPFVVPFYIRKITAEDNRVCEQLQQIASQIHSFPILSRYEERIAWFEEAYAAAMGEVDQPGQGAQQAKN